MRYLETLFWKFAVYLIHKGYGPKCDTSDLDDYAETFKSPMDVFGKGRCACCRANEAVDWIEEHIELINWDWSE
jgi:hypothetical protein